jgi:hypothetical protein
MVEVRPVRTGSIRIRPSSWAGDMHHPVWRRRLAILLDRDWTEPLPIYTYLVEHDEGLILLDSGESALSAKPGWFPCWSRCDSRWTSTSSRGRDRAPTAVDRYRPGQGLADARAVASAP